MAEEEQHEPAVSVEQTAPVEVPGVLPVLPLKNTVIFPHLLAPLLVNTDRSKKLIEDVMAGRERLMLSVAVKGALDGSPRREDLHRVGTVLRTEATPAEKDGDRHTWRARTFAGERLCAEGYVVVRALPRDKAVSGSRLTAPPISQEPEFD